MDKIYYGLLKKFAALKGKVLIGKHSIKGENTADRLPPDEFVPDKHILHNLIRGFYKPAGKPFLLSYQATEEEENYGKQIIWDSYGRDFVRIEMHPPSSEKDPLRKSDIAAARYNLQHGLPIGILYKIKKGHNKILGLGLITSERIDGVFIVEPYNFESTFKYNIQEAEFVIKEENIETSFSKETDQRKGQNNFKKKLLNRSPRCAVCNLGEPALLNASHIKPWKSCSDRERFDPNNGLLLCPNHDKLFDRGYITFTEEGDIKISSLISPEIADKTCLSKKIALPVPEDMKIYLKWHQEKCFWA